MSPAELSNRIRKTPMTINGYTYPGDPVKRIECRDGFHMSVQACQYTFCSPRDNSGPWTLVEVGYPSDFEETLLPYIDGSEDAPLDTVYGYVPIEIVIAIIERHGGEREFVDAEAADVAG